MTSQPPAPASDSAPEEATVITVAGEGATRVRFIPAQLVPDADGVARVLFRAGVFTRGRDVGFVECSEFAHDGVGWRYLRGVTVARSDAATIVTFRARHPHEEGA